MPGLRRQSRRYPEHTDRLVVMDAPVPGIPPYNRKSVLPPDLRRTATTIEIVVAVRPLPCALLSRIFPSWNFPTS